MDRFMLVRYKIENGFLRDFKVLEYSNNKERLEYILQSMRYSELKEKGYIIKVWKECE